jgi:hypothetical protein
MGVHALPEGMDQSGYKRRVASLRQPNSRAVSPDKSGSGLSKGLAQSEDIVVHGGFMVLPRRSLLELVKDSRNPAEVKLLRWDGRSAKIGRRIAFHDKTFVPPEIAPGKIQNMLLPSDVEPGGAPRELIEDIGRVLTRFLDMRESEILLAAHYGVYTWFPDLFPVAPILWLVGPLGSGKTTLLRLLSRVCRRSVLLGDTTLASMYLLANELQPTLILDEADLDKGQDSGELRRFLRNGHTMDFSVARNGELYSVFGPRVLASRRPPKDAALASRAIFISMSPTGRHLPPLTHEAVVKIGEDFQNRLLGFRLENYFRPSSPKHSEADLFTPRMRDMARALALPLQNDVESLNRLFEILGEQDRAIRVERSLEPEWLTVEALFQLCHEQVIRRGQDINQTLILVGAVADEINRKLKNWGADKFYYPRGVGPILRSIGVWPKKLSRWGCGMELNPAFRRRIHELARQYGFSRLDITPPTAIETGCGGRACPLCKEFGLEAGLRMITPKQRSDDHLAIRNRTEISQAREHTLSPRRVRVLRDGNE